MKIKNLYIIVPVKGLTHRRLKWAVQKNLQNCRKNQDGTKAIIKLPLFLREQEINNQWFKKSKPFYTHSKILKELSKEEWKTPIEVEPTKTIWDKIKPSIL